VEHCLNAYEEGSPEPHFEELLQHAGAMVREDISEWLGALTKTRADAAPTNTEKFANYDIVKHPDGSLFQ